MQRNGKKEFGVVATPLSDASFHEELKDLSQDELPSVENA